MEFVQPIRSDPEAFDVVPEEFRPRELYFISTTGLDIDGFIARGYKPIAICTLPTKTEDENERYHRCLMRGTIEGTIAMTKLQSDALEVDLKAHDRLGNKKFTNEKQQSKKSNAMSEALNWRETRHSLANSTNIDPRAAIDLINKIRSLTPDQISELSKEKKDV